MIVHPLSVVMLASRYDVTDITALYRIIAILVHQIISLLHVTLVISHWAWCLMMHHQLYTFWFSIVVEHLNIKIGIRGNKIKDIILGFTKPIFPADIPTFHKKLVKAIFRCEINVALHVLVIGGMLPEGMHLRVISLIKSHRRQVIGIRPLLAAGNHFPPYTHIFNGLYPWDILVHTWLVKIEDKIWCENISGIITDHDGAPRGMRRTLYMSLMTLCIRSEPWAEHQRRVIKIQMHAGIIHKCGFMDIDV